MNFTLLKTGKMTTIKGYVARDLSTKDFERGDLFCYLDVPKREDGLWVMSNNYDGSYFRLPTESFKNIDWTDEPVEVEITIK